jgi:hypothetical protein
MIERCGMIFGKPERGNGERASLSRSFEQIESVEKCETIFGKPESGVG